MNEKATTFKEWHEVFQGSSWRDKSRVEALEKMASLARSFSEWRLVFYRSGLNEKVRKKARSKMLELGDFDGWLDTYFTTPSRGELEKISGARITELAFTFSQWRIVHKHLPQKSRIRKKAFWKMLAALFLLRWEMNRITP